MGLLTDVVQKNIELKHQKELDALAARRNFYGKAAWDDSLSDEVRNYAQDQYFKTLQPEAKKSA